MNFIGRKAELERLKKAYRSEEFEGILVYGRRRIGKSELIKESVRGESCTVIYFECMKVSEPSNVKAFCEVIGKAFGIPTPSFSSLREALEYLFQYSCRQKIIVVMDEYPYLREKTEGCDSIFQHVIDEYASGCRMKLVLCGSYIDVMEKLTERDNPLYRRLGTTLHVKQMDYFESALFYPAFSDEDKVKIYSVFGGIPYYNHFIDDGLSVRENIIALIASSEARFGSSEAFAENEMSKIVNANETFLAIAKGKTKFSDILNSSHVSSSPSLADTLKKLISMEMIKKESPINDESEKKSYYLLSDRLSHFYYRYIFPKYSYFSTMSADDFYDEFIQEDFEKQYVPKEFEDIVKQYLVRKNKTGEWKPTLHKVGKYYYDDPKNKRNGEFDVVTLSKHGYDFFEVKFTKEPVGDDTVREETAQLNQAGISYRRLGFVSKSGFSLSDRKDYILLTLEDLFRD